MVVFEHCQLTSYMFLISSWRNESGATEQLIFTVILFVSSFTTNHLSGIIDTTYIPFFHALTKTELEIRNFGFFSAYPEMAILLLVIVYSWLSFVINDVDMNITRLIIGDDSGFYITYNTDNTRKYFAAFSSLKGKAAYMYSVHTETLAQPSIAIWLQKMKK